MMVEQFTIDGGSVTSDAMIPTRTHGIRLTPVQSAILRVIDEEGSITSTRAGTIVHEARTGGRPETRCQRGTKVEYGTLNPDTKRRTIQRTPRTNGECCCKWAGTDGGSAMKRLRERGLAVQHEPRGPWTRPHPTHEGEWRGR